MGLEDKDITSSHRSHHRLILISPQTYDSELEKLGGETIFLWTRCGFQRGNLFLTFGVGGRQPSICSLCQLLQPEPKSAFFWSLDCFEESYRIYLVFCISKNCNSDYQKWTFDSTSLMLKLVITSLVIL